MRDMPAYCGRCPVADDSPEILACNELAVSIYNECRQTAQQIEARDKNYHFLRLTEIEATMRMNDVPQEERPGLLQKIKLLEEIANQMRPLRPRPRPSRR